MQKHKQRIYTNQQIFCAAVIISLMFAFLNLQTAQAQTIVLDGPYQTRITFQSITPSPAFINQPVTITVLVEPLDPAGGIPSGLVEVKTGGSKVCEITLGVDGGGSCLLSFDSPAVFPLQAFYLGTNVYLPAATASMDLRVRDKFQPRVEITSDTPDPSIINRVVRVATSVSNVFSETATGELTVYRSLTEICSESAAAAAVDRCGVILDAAGHGACDLAITASGALNLCAVYEGDTAHYPAVSLPERHMVSLSNSFVELLSITPAPYILGQSAQADFRVTSPDGSPQTGMVAIYAGKTRLCSAAAAAGKCSFTLPQPNLLTLYAAYAGELDGQIVLQPSTSDPQTITVFAPPTAIRLSTLTVDAYRGETSVEAKLSAVDPNPDDQFVFTLVSGDGDEDNRYFRVRGDQLFAIGNIPYGDGWVNIRLRAVDQTGLSVEESFQLRLNNNQPLLPNTGFAPHRVSAIPAPKTDYASYAGLQIEIPVLGSQAAIVGVPLSGQEWDTSWLGNQAGWLAGSAFPGWVGNSYLAAHNYLPSGLPGPFENIADLRWGDQVLIHAYGTTSVYEVRSVQWVSPNNKRVLTHEEDAWLTLVTCDQYDETQQAYRWRVVVRAALVDVE